MNYKAKVVPKRRRGEESSQKPIQADPETGRVDKSTLPKRSRTKGGNKYDPNGRKYCEEHKRSDGINVPKEYDHRNKDE